MSTRISGNSMSSDKHGLVATCLGSVDGWEQWEVSWLPGRVLRRDQATTAMVLADAVVTNELPSGSRMWPFIDGWAAELGMSGPAAVGRIAEASLDITLGKLERGE